MFCLMKAWVRKSSWYNTTPTANLGAKDVSDVSQSAKRAKPWYLLFLTTTFSAGLCFWIWPSSISDSLRKTCSCKHSGAKNPCVPQRWFGTVAVSGLRKLANPKSPVAPEIRLKPSTLCCQLEQAWNMKSALNSRLLTRARKWQINSCVIPNSLKILEGFWLSAPEPSGTLSAICTGTLRNLISHLPRTLQNLINHLHGNAPEPHQPSAPEPSGTSSAFCTGTLRNAPEPHQPSTPESSGNLRNLLRNLVLQLHRIAPELFWAKDPIASFAVGEKYWTFSMKVAAFTCSSRLLCRHVRNPLLAISCHHHVLPRCWLVWCLCVLFEDHEDGKVLARHCGTRRQLQTPCSGRGRSPEITGALDETDPRQSWSCDPVLQRKLALLHEQCTDSLLHSVLSLTPSWVQSTCFHSRSMRWGHAQGICQERLCWHVEETKASHNVGASFCSLQHVILMQSSSRWFLSSASLLAREYNRKNLAQAFQILRRLINSKPHNVSSNMALYGNFTATVLCPKQASVCSDRSYLKDPQSMYGERGGAELLAKLWTWIVLDWVANFLRETHLVELSYKLSVLFDTSKTWAGISCFARWLKQPLLSTYLKEKKTWLQTKVDPPRRRKWIGVTEI